MASEFTVQRFNGSLIAGLEKRALIAMARRLPGWATPDRLTGFGVFGALVVFVAYCLCSIDVRFLWLANLGLLFHWLGDSLDGTVARVRGIERPKFGFFVDQTIDLIGNLLIAAGMGVSPWVRLDVALLVLTAYHMLSIYVLVYSLVKGEFRLDVGGFGPTEVRLGIVGLNVCILIFGGGGSVIAGADLTWCDLTLLAVFVLLISLFIFELVTKARSIDD